MEVAEHPREGNFNVNIVKSELKEDDEDSYNTMLLLELANCVETNQEPIEFNSSDAVTNPSNGNMICVHCLEEVAPNLLSDHMISQHNYRKLLYKCYNCEEKFHDRDSLNLHKKECIKPPQKKRRKLTFNHIMRQIDNDNSGDGLEITTCPICILDLPKYTLKEHLLKEHKDPSHSYNCMKCCKEFKSKLTLREHVRMVHESIEDSVECDLCGQKFSSIKYMHNHKRNVHPTGGKVHECEHCGKTFKSRLCVHQHMKSVHPPANAVVTCPHCPKMFKSRINLRQHLSVSHGISKNVRSCTNTKSNEEFDFLDTFDEEIH